MTGTYDPIHVLLSLAISIIASWATLEIVVRITLQERASRRQAWIFLGSFAMGIGVWSMHYIGMLAYRMNMPVLYDWPTVLLSMMAAVAAAGLALQMICRPVLTWRATLLGSVFMGSGISAMHYIGMAAMRMPAKTHYAWPLVALSVVAAIVISIAAIQVGFRSRTHAKLWSWRKAGSALLLGLAIPTMHYIGMAAASWTDSPESFSAERTRHTVAVSNLSSIGIVLVVGTLFALVVTLALLDRRILEFKNDLRGREQRNEVLHWHNVRLRSVVRAGGVGFWEWDPETELFQFDGALRDMYGLPHDNLPVPREAWFCYVHPDDALEKTRAWAKSLANGFKYENDFRVVLRDGEVRSYKALATVRRAGTGEVIGVSGMTWDVTEERAKEHHAKELAERFRKTLEAIGDAVIATDDQHRIVFLNHAACALTGWPSEEAIGQRLEDVFHTCDEQTGLPRRNPVVRCVEAGGLFLSEDGILVSRGGERYNIKKHVSLISSSDSAVITFQDITQSRKMQKSLEHAALHDALTGLRNRSAFEKHLEAVWHETEGTIRSHCLCIVDLDRFKIINDTSGHMAGDALLRHVAGLLTASCRPADCVARMGGDEFMLLLVDTNAVKGEMCASRILESLRTATFPWHGKSYDVSASIGMVNFGYGSPPPEELISQADVACFMAKRNGRNQVAVYSGGESDAANHELKDMQTVAAIREALESGRFELHAQPICEVHTPKSPTYYELLVRMRNKEGRLVPPSEFIPPAEHYGLIDLIDRWVIRTAFHEGAAVAQEYRFSINLSAQSLSDPNLWAFVLEQFEASRIRPARVTFEITESSIIQNVSHALTFLNNARQLGCSIALDDFGVGMSSLSYLKKFPLDVVKIDGSFIKRIAEQPLDQAIVAAVAEIARAMNATTVAECVEDEATLHTLRGLDVDFAQGWATGRPIPLSEAFQKNAQPTEETSHRGLYLLSGSAA